eukprot:m.183366 g.183366  ORF g.183366 m.183366 type:complete len:114 (+) comp14690_c1_seq5:1406-1747(+)
MAMAYKKRLVRERQKFLEAPPDGMTLLPSQVPDALVWQVAIQGPEGSLYDGEVYTLQLTFSEKYPFDSPEVLIRCELNSHHSAMKLWHSLFLLPRLPLPTLPRPPHCLLLACL